MSATNRTPLNTNLLQPTKYLLTFTKIPATQYFCQSINIPGVTVSQLQINTPVHDYYVAGNKQEHSNLNINFLLDEQIESWKNIFYWMKSFSSPKNIEERKRIEELLNDVPGLPIKGKGIYSDAVLTVLSNLNNPMYRIQYYNCFPISLSDITFDTRQSADDIMTADASFVYEYFEILPA